MAELQTRMKKWNEDWAVYGEDLKQLADKAYPDLEDAARERFAMNQYLTQLTNPQVAFSVRQAKPKTVDEAVHLTLEMESIIQGINYSSMRRSNFLHFYWSLVTYLPKDLKTLEGQGKSSTGSTKEGHSRYDRWYRESPPSAGPKPRRCWKK